MRGKCTENLQATEMKECSDVYACYITTLSEWALLTYSREEYAGIL